MPFSSIVASVLAASCFVFSACSLIAEMFILFKLYIRFQPFSPETFYKVKSFSKREALEIEIAICNNFTEILYRFRISFDYFSLKNYLNEHFLSHLI